MEVRRKMLKIRQKRTRYNETVSINRLPVELFSLILSHLDRSDLFAYESVCTKWSYYVKRFVGERLVISKWNKPTPRSWFYLNEIFLPDSVMLRTDLDVKLVQNSFMFDVKQLKICNAINKSADESDALLVDTEFINQLAGLEVLEVSQLGLGIYQQHLEVNLPNLKYLAIERFRQCHLYLNCPKLNSFKTKMFYYSGKDFFSFYFLHPLSVTHLYLQKFGSKRHNCNIEKLHNLQHLSISTFDYRFERKEENRQFSAKIFSNFPNLKEISVQPGSSDYSYYLSRETYESLLKERNALSRTGVALTFYGIRIEDVLQLGCNKQDLHQKDRFLGQLYMRNYANLLKEHLRWVKWISYSGLMEGVRERIPDDFPEKFGSVKEIQIEGKVEDERQLVAFLGKFKRLNSLRIEKEAHLPVSFYRSLAVNCPTNRYLTIQMEPPDEITDFEFLFEFKQLAGFVVRGRCLVGEFVRRAFRHFDAFAIGYSTPRDDIHIRRTGRQSKFEFSVYPGHLEVFEHLDELLQLLYKIRHGTLYETHNCTCSCEFFDCYRHSYTVNVRKRLD